MKQINFRLWGKFGFEFLSIFIAVVSAFALNNWNDNRKDRLSENKILSEINQGLSKDLSDMKGNVVGHETGIQAVEFFSTLLHTDSIPTDSLLFHYFNLTRDYVSIQNVAGYESLKSKGLELIQDDSLRNAIIALYEFDYQVLRKLEEEYAEMQFQLGHFDALNMAFSKNVTFGKNHRIAQVNAPFQLSETERSDFMLRLWKILTNRYFILQFYRDVEAKILELQERIKEELER